MMNNIAIGFVTGRKSFRRVLKTYAFRWKDLIEENGLRVNLIVAYDLEYNHTNPEDFTYIRQDVLSVFHSVTFLGQDSIHSTCEELADNGILNRAEVERLFGKGYAGKRNAVLYEAIRQNMEALIFLDDDEYPLAVTNRHGTALWSGQNVFLEHIRALENHDVTNGYHCGYVSPIPQMEFREGFTLEDFRKLIETVSNDILSWESLQEIMDNGGVTYGDIEILTGRRLVELKKGSGDGLPISGSNLGISLRHPERTVPFFNPRGARGEDTFFAAALQEQRVARIPVYAFHDGFMQYSGLLRGILPRHLRQIRMEDAGVQERFYKACLGWIRYKPLFMYLSDKENYDAERQRIQKQLNELTPKMEACFHMPYGQLSREFRHYSERVKEDEAQFRMNLDAWGRLMRAEEKNKTKKENVI